jgi:hypothetical protein
VINVLDYLADDHKVERLQVECADSIEIRAINCHDVEPLIVRLLNGSSINVEADQLPCSAGQTSVEPTSASGASPFAPSVRKPDMCNAHASRALDEPGIPIVNDVGSGQLVEPWLFAFC